MKNIVLTVNGVKTSVWNHALQIVLPDEVSLVEGDVEENGELRPLTEAELESVPCEEVYELASERSFWD